MINTDKKTKIYAILGLGLLVLGAATVFAAPKTTEDGVSCEYYYDKNTMTWSEHLRAEYSETWATNYCNDLCAGVSDPKCGSNCMECHGFSISSGGNGGSGGFKVTANKIDSTNLPGRVSTDGYSTSGSIDSIDSTKMQLVQIQPTKVQGR